MDAITDRTNIDIEIFKQLRIQMLNLMGNKEEYFKACERACFLDSTANRIENNTMRMNEIMQFLSYMQTMLPIKTDWDQKSFDNVKPLEELERMRLNIAALIKAYRAPPTSIPSNMNLSEDYYNKINAIEKILLEFDEILNNIIVGFRYSGEVYAGDE